MKITCLYPVICTRNVAESKAFYLEHFPFEVAFDSDGTLRGIQLARIRTVSSVAVTIHK